MKRTFWRVDIAMGERIPAGFGTAWWVSDRDARRVMNNSACRASSARSRT